MLSRPCTDLAVVVGSMVSFDTTKELELKVIELVSSIGGSWAEDSRSSLLEDGFTDWLTHSGSLNTMLALGDKRWMPPICGTFPLVSDESSAWDLEQMWKEFDSDAASNLSIPMTDRARTIIATNKITSIAIILNGNFWISK